MLSNKRKARIVDEKTISIVMSGLKVELYWSESESDIAWNGYIDFSVVCSHWVAAEKRNFSLSRSLQYNSALSVEHLSTLFMRLLPLTILPIQTKIRVFYQKTNTCCLSINHLFQGRVRCFLCLYEQPLFSFQCKFNSFHVKSSSFHMIYQTNFYCSAQSVQTPVNK